MNNTQFNFYIDIKQNIDVLHLSTNILILLKQNHIFTLYELIKKNKNDLKKIGCNSIQITEIEIKLQLEGLDLNMKFTTI